MPIFKFIGIQKNGNKVKGSVDALSRKQAILKIKTEYNADLVSLEEVSINITQKPVEEAKTSNKKILERAGEKVALDFFEKLLQLNGSGLSVGDSIRTLSRRVTDISIKNLTNALWKDLSEGFSLATALSRYPKIFDNTIVHLVEAGEATGHITPILKNIIELLETKIALKKKIAASLVYPIVISLMALSVVALFLFFLLPRIKGMLSSLGGELSFSAKLLIGSADIMIKQGPFILIALIFFIIFLMQWRKSKAGKQTTDKIFLKLPLIGPLIINADINRISNLMSILLESGITMNEALVLTEKAIKNTNIKERFAASKALINDGASFSSATAYHKIFPDMDIDILTVGENTGNLVNSFKEIYKIHSLELQSQLKIITTSISSGAMVFAFTLVAILTFGIVSSIMQLSQSLLRQ